MPFYDVEHITCCKGIFKMEKDWN